MRPRNLIVSFVIGTLLVAWGLMTRGKEGVSFFFLGAVVLVSSLAITVIRRGNPKPPPNNRRAIVGAIFGAITGGSIGYNFPPLGRMILDTFNPDLPERDFAAGFGSIGGSLLGAVLGAVLCDLFCGPWRKVRRDEADIAAQTRTDEFYSR